MAPFFTGITRGIGGGGFGKMSAEKIIAVRFYIEIFGAKGNNFGINLNGSPPAEDPAQAQNEKNGTARSDHKTTGFMNGMLFVHTLKY